MCAAACRCQGRRYPENPLFDMKKTEWSSSQPIKTRFLGRAQHWFADGTFVPAEYVQLYSLHAYHVLPMYLLPGKSGAVE